MQVVQSERATYICVDRSVGVLLSQDPALLLQRQYRYSDAGEKTASVGLPCRGVMTTHPLTHLRVLAERQDLPEVGDRLLSENLRIANVAPNPLIER